MPDFKKEDICHAAPEHVKAIYKGITGQDLPDDMINRMQVEACKIAEEKPMEISGVSFEMVKEAVIEQTNPLRVNSDLAQSIKDENLAIEVYEIRATAAEFFGDYETRALYEHVIKEEKEHAREFTERLDVKEKENG